MPVMCQWTLWRLKCIYDLSNFITAGLMAIFLENQHITPNHLYVRNSIQLNNSFHSLIQSLRNGSHQNSFCPQLEHIHSNLFDIAIDIANLLDIMQNHLAVLILGLNQDLATMIEEAMELIDENQNGAENHLNQLQHLHTQLRIIRSTLQNLRQGNQQNRLRPQLEQVHREMEDIHSQLDDIIINLGINWEEFKIWARLNQFNYISTD